MKLPGLTENAVKMRHECIEFLAKRRLMVAVMDLQNIAQTFGKYLGPEDWLHISTCLYIKFAYLTLKVTHPKNEGKAGNVEQMKKKKMGVCQGASDLLIQRKFKTRSLWIELKVKPNRPTPEQVEFINFQRECGHVAEFAYNIEQAAKIIDEYAQA